MNTVAYSNLFKKNVSNVFSTVYNKSLTIKMLFSICL